MRSWLVLLMALALVTAACSSTNDDEGAGDSTTAGSTAETTGDSESPGTTVAEGSDPAPDTTVAESVELTASSDGVTEDTIRYGIINIDAAGVAQFGVDLAVLPMEEMYQAWSDAQNERGGVLGRNLEPHLRVYVPAFQALADAPCRELVDDVEVFAIIGQLFADHMRCVTEQSGRPYIGHFGVNEERKAFSDGLFVATEMENIDQRTGGVQAMIDQGDLEGKTVALWWDNPVDVEFADAVRPLLDAAGIDIALEVEVGDFGDDVVAADAAEDVQMERIVAAGVDFIIALSNILPITEAVARADTDPITIGFTNGQAADRILFPDAIAPEEVKANTFAITTSKPSPADALADPEVQRCIAEYEAAYPDGPFLDLDDDEYVQGIVNNCRVFVLMVMLFEAAGADLTPESFVEASETAFTEPFDLPAMSGATLSADKKAAGALIRRYEYDAELGFHVGVDEPFLPNV